MKSEMSEREYQALKNRYLSLADDELYGVQSKTPQQLDWHYQLVAITKDEAYTYVREESSQAHTTQFRIVKFSRHLPKGASYPLPHEIIKHVKAKV